MDVDAPPINGTARQKLAWLAGVVLTLLTILMLASGARLLRHDAQIAVHETKIEALVHTLERIEAKLDRMLALDTPRRAPRDRSQRERRALPGAARQGLERSP